MAMVAVGTLKALPYSTSWIVHVDDLAAEPPPTEHIEVGPLVWNLVDYRTAPSLEPFRRAFTARCGALKGLPAAKCITGVITEHSSRGDPKTEFVDANYDPARDLDAHLKGEVGHCTTRSALTVTGLLSLGIPSRVVQFLPPNSPAGHNVVGVWDAEQGWSVFDPFYGATIDDANGPVSSVDVANNAGRLRWGESEKPITVFDPTYFVGSTISYPEPWLYTRVGERCAQWPFRGCFVQIGPTQFIYGPAQKLAFFGGLVAGLLSALCFLGLVIRRLRPLRRESDLSVPLPVGVETPRS